MLQNGLRDFSSVVRTLFDGAAINHGRCGALARMAAGQRLLALSSLNRTLDDHMAGSAGLLGRQMITYAFMKKKIVLVGPAARAVDLCDPGGGPDSEGDDEDDWDGGGERGEGEGDEGEREGNRAEKPIAVVVKVPVGKSRKRLITVRAYPGCDNARSALLRALRLAKVKSLPIQVMTELVKDIERQATAARLLPDAFTCRFVTGPTPDSVTSVVVTASLTAAGIESLVRNITVESLLTPSYHEAIHRVLTNLAFGAGLSSDKEPPAYHLDAYQSELVHPESQVATPVPMIAHLTAGSAIRAALWSRYHPHFVSGGPANIRDFSASVQVAMSTMPWTSWLPFTEFSYVSRCANMSALASRWAREVERRGHQEPPVLATMDAETALRVAAVVHEVVSTYKIATISDLGCGDNTPLPEALSRLGVSNVSYIGVDLPGRVRKAPRAPDGITTEFRIGCLFSSPPPPSDLIIVRRVLEFLPTMAQRAALRMIASSNPFSRYLLVSTNTRVGERENQRDSRFFGDYSPINLERRPFGVSPIQMWSDGGKGNYLALYALPLDGYPDRAFIEADSDLFIDRLGTRSEASYFKEDPSLMEKWLI